MCSRSRDHIPGCRLLRQSGYRKGLRLAIEKATEESVQGVIRDSLFSHDVAIRIPRDRLTNSVVVWMDITVLSSTTR